MIEAQLFETLFDIMPFGVYVMDVETYEIIYVNRMMREQRGDCVGQICWRAIYQQEGPCEFCKVNQLLDDARRSNGETVAFPLFSEAEDAWRQLLEKAVSWPDGRTVKYSIAVDITELKDTQNKLAEAHAKLALKSKELERLANEDSLLGIANRLSLDAQYAQLILQAAQSGRPLSIIIMDVDHFKKVNDSFGHLVGDDVLKRIAAVMKAGLDKDFFLGRWGGEEFLVLCPNADCDEAVALAERLRREIEAAARPSPAHPVTASFGVAQYTPGDNADSLLTRADHALYNAKNNGRNRVAHE